jgi:hypothetical protein
MPFRAQLLEYGAIPNGTGLDQSSVKAFTYAGIAGDFDRGLDCCPWHRGRWHYGDLGCVVLLAARGAGRSDFCHSGERTLLSARATPSSLNAWARLPAPSELAR